MTPNDPSNSDDKSVQGDTESDFSEQIAARVPEGATERLEEVAYQLSEPGDHKSVSDVVRRALDEYLDDFDFVVDEDLDREE